MKVIFLSCAIAAGVPVFDDLDKFISNQMEHGHIPGLSAVVLKGDKILWDGHFGSTQPSLKDAPQVSNTTVFEFASLSKTLIGIAAMLLYEKGLLKPQDDVSTHLPFQLRNPYFLDVPITLHGLLTHTSSIKDDAYNDIPAGQIYFEGDAPMSLEAFYNAMLKRDGKWYKNSNFWNRMPQTHFDYSNIGASLAAYIVEIVAKKASLAESYDGFVRSYILKPLGISNAGYLVKDFGGETKLQPPSGAIPSAFKEQKGQYDSYCFYGFPDYPDGSFKGSALDYARVFGAFINNGSFQGTQLLTPQTVAYMKQHTGAPCEPLPCGGSLPQGNAFFYFEEQAGRTMLGHNGGEMGIATEAFFHVESGVGYVILTNGDWDQSKEFSNAFAAIEEKLMATFDDTVSSKGRVSGRPMQQRRLHVATAARCPCGLPCNSLSESSLLV